MSDKVLSRFEQGGPSPEFIVGGVRTVVGIASHFERLKQTATSLLDARPASERGYFTPSEDEEVRHLLVSYWQSRNALIELVVMLHRSAASYDESEPDVRHLPTHDKVVAFLVAWAGALVLIDAARFRFLGGPKWCGTARRSLSVMPPIESCLMRQ